MFLPSAICKRYTNRVNATSRAFAIVGKSGAQKTMRYTHLAGFSISAGISEHINSAITTAYGDAMQSTKLNKKENTHTLLNSGMLYGEEFSSAQEFIKRSERLYLKRRLFFKTQDTDCADKSIIRADTKITIGKKMFKKSVSAKATTPKSIPRDMHTKIKPSCLTGIFLAL